jgi:hypothetical protein
MSPPPLTAVVGAQARCDEQLLDRDRSALLAAQGAVSRRSTFLASDEEHIVLEHLHEHLPALALP